MNLTAGKRSKRVDTHTTALLKKPDRSNFPIFPTPCVDSCSVLRHGGEDPEGGVHLCSRRSFGGGEGLPRKDGHNALRSSRRIVPGRNVSIDFPMPDAAPSWHLTRVSLDMSDWIHHSVKGFFGGHKLRSLWIWSKRSGRQTRCPYRAALTLPPPLPPSIQPS